MEACKKRAIFRSKIDWWVWCVVALTYAVLIPCYQDSYWWLTVIFGLIFTALYIAGLCGTWYEIDDSDLIVYQFFKPYRFPIAKIKEVKYTKSVLATAGMSSRRVSIKFVDPGVMKSYAPLEISPKNRDAFCAQLQSVNPEIEIIK